MKSPPGRVVMKSGGSHRRSAMTRNVQRAGVGDACVVALPAPVTPLESVAQKRLRKKNGDLLLGSQRTARVLLAAWVKAASW